MVTTRVELEVTDDGFGFTLDDPMKGVLDNTTYKLSTGWRDVTDYVVSVSSSRGRNRDLEKFNAGSLTVRLRNEARTFDPLNLSSPFVNEMVPKRYVRVFADEVQQFEGLVDSWKLSYSPSGESLAEVSVTDAFGFLAAQDLDETYPEELSGARVRRVLNDAGWGVIDNPVVLTTNLVTNPSMEAGSGVVTVRTNLVTNPSFETNTAGWSFGTRVTTQFYVGTASLERVATALNENTGITVPVSVSQTYTASAWVKGEAGKLLRIRLLEYTSADVYVAETNGADVTATGGWQRITVTRTFGSTGAKARVSIANRTAGAHTFYVDAVQLEVGSTASPYFDGSTSASGDFTYAWSGTAHASTSLQRGVPVTGISNFAGRVNLQSSEWASSGSKSLRIVPTGTFGESGNGAVLVNQASLVNGKTYTVKGKLRLSAPQTGTLDPRARRIFVGSTSAVFQSNQPPNTAGVHDVSLTFTYGGSGDIRLANGASAGNGDVWWDDLIVVEGTYTGDYFDGNTPDTQNDEYYWTGTPNASTSIWKETTGIDLGNSTIAAGTYTDTALQHLQLVEASEAGLLFIGKDGALIFKARNSFTSGYVPVVFADDGTGIPFTGAQVEYGTDLLFNQVSVTYPSGTAIADNTTSQAKYGVISHTVDTLLASGSTAQDYASYYVGEYGEPEYRFSSIDVTLRGLTATQVGDVLQLEIGDLVLIRFTPNSVGSVIERFAVVTSLDNDVTFDDYRVRVGVSSLDSLGFVLDDLALGIMDSNVLAF